MYFRPGVLLLYRTKIISPKDGEGNAWCERARKAHISLAHGSTQDNALTIVLSDFLKNGIDIPEWIKVPTIPRLVDSAIDYYLKKLRAAGRSKPLNYIYSQKCQY